MRVAVVSRLVEIDSAERSSITCVCGPVDTRKRRIFEERAGLENGVHDDVVAMTVALKIPPRTIRFSLIA